MKKKKRLEEREYIQADTSGMWMLKQMLGIRKRTCHYCKKHLKKGDKFSIFNKPTRLVCDSILCLIEAMNEDE